jgi:hypothetical protein
MDIKLSSPDNIKIKALHDRGCAKTLIKHSLFEKLLQHGQTEIQKPERQIVLISCTGEAQPIEGSADIILHFEGSNGINTAYHLLSALLLSFLPLDPEFLLHLLLLLFCLLSGF